MREGDVLEQLLFYDDLHATVATRFRVSIETFFEKMCEVHLSYLHRKRPTLDAADVGMFHSILNACKYLPNERVGFNSLNGLVRYVMRAPNAVELRKVVDSNFLYIQILLHWPTWMYSQAEISWAAIEREFNYLMCTIGLPINVPQPSIVGSDVRSQGYPSPIYPMYERPMTCYHSINTAMVDLLLYYGARYRTPRFYIKRWDVPPTPELERIRRYHMDRRLHRMWMQPVFTYIECNPRNGKVFEAGLEAIYGSST